MAFQNGGCASKRYSANNIYLGMGRRVDETTPAKRGEKQHYGSVVSGNI